MNTVGTLFRVSVFGESHGECVGVLIDGCPAGLPLTQEDFAADLERRRGGGARGTTPRRESDVPMLRSGVFRGRTTGAPILIEFANADTHSRDYAAVRRVPRPGHADLVADLRYGGHQDHRGGGAFSGRLTVALVAAGVIAKRLCGFGITARVISAGGSADVEQAVSTALAAGDSVGGVVECRAAGIPVGLGEPFADSVESLLAHAAFAIPAVKGIEFGAGFAGAEMRGSEHNDRYLDTAGTTASNHSGGISGGLSNGNELVFRLAVKPTSSIRIPQQTIDRDTGELTTLQVHGRHDACIALRVPPIAEAITAIVFADLLARAGLLPRVWPDARP